MEEKLDNNKLDITYYAVYRNLLDAINNNLYLEENMEITNVIKRILRYALHLLNGLENSLQLSYTDFQSMVYRNMEFTSMNETDFDFVRQYIASLTKKMDSLKKPEKIRSPLYLFNIVINHVTELVNQAIDFNKLEITNQNQLADSNQVFLSYAHLDRLYTLGLFSIFHSAGIYLYIDWMHNGEIEDIKLLKNILDTAMNNSKQFLFLRTYNSELGILGSGQIRQWCAWEIGNYYCKNQGEKFYTNIYEFLIPSKTSSILNTFKPLRLLSGGKMH